MPVTESRWRPLTAFALVSLLSAVILAVNLGHTPAHDVVAARAAGDQPGRSQVVFGDVLQTRPTRAQAPLSATLSGVGPLDTAAKEPSRATAGAHPAGNRSAPVRHRPPRRHHAQHSSGHLAHGTHATVHHMTAQHVKGHHKARHHKGRHHKGRHHKGRHHGSWHHGATRSGDHWQGPRHHGRDHGSHHHGGWHHHGHHRW